MPIRLFPALLFCLLAAGQATGDLLSQLGKSEVLKVDDAFRPSLFFPADGGLIVDFSIRGDYYLYEAAFALYIDAEKVPFEIRGEPVDLQDDFFGLTRVFFNRAALLLQEKPATGELRVEFQGCARGRFCYPPRLWIFNLADLTGSPASRRSFRKKSG